MTYRAPLRDIRFALDHIADLGGLEPAFPDLSADLVEAVLAEAGKLAEAVIAPLNAPGDRAGARLEHGAVSTPAGFKAAWKQFAEGGWGAVPFDPAYGGQGLPHTLSLGVQEMVHGANLSFGLCPLLTQGAIELLQTHGSPDQKALYLPKLIAGTWTGTMNLTEPQAGSDVGAVRAKAERAGDGTYRITGTKIFITFGDHDMAENIVHLVLARLPDGAPGTRGISLFLVPKFIPNADGSPGTRNDVRCAGIEHKLGIHASPTCVMSFGDDGGATGWLVGAEHGGLKAMFTMMNSARLGVGLEAVGVAEAATQKALAYAQERLQGKPYGLQHALRDMVPIYQHADVRRMLLTMKSLTEAMRAICYATARAADGGDPARENVLTPIAKGWCTDKGVQVASLGIQIHGGMGFVEETGAAQYFRDARILPIYEGTNGIQAIDLVTRKLTLEGGAAFEALCADIAGEVKALEATGDPLLIGIARRLGEGEAALARSGRWLRARLGESPNDALAGAAPFLDMAGLVVGGWLLAKGARAATGPASKALGTDYAQARRTVAAFFADNLLSQAPGLRTAVEAGSALIDALAADQLGL